jgi:hypothetical protein
MKLMRRRTEYSLLDHRRNDNLEELKVEPLEMKLARYKQKLLGPVIRLEDIKLPNQHLDYRPAGGGEEEDLDDR